MTTAAFTVNCSILLTDRPLLKRPSVVRDAGFDAVEFCWPFTEPVPSDRETAAFIRAIADAGVLLSGLDFAAGDMAAGERGMLSDPCRSSIFRDSVDVAIGIAEVLGTKAFNALYGNRIDGVNPAVQDEIAVQNLAYAANAADRIGAVVLVEPVSGARAYPLKKAIDAIEVIDRVVADCDHRVRNLRLLADLYHLSVNGDAVGSVLDTYGDRIGHVQIADAPGRGEPGTGTLDLVGYLDQLAANGYRGYVGLEYKATRPDPFDWLPRARRCIPHAGGACAPLWQN
ncbi:hydroxypyruvate isomerase [Mycolicibacterium agri]|uniref:Hydroxypyruvate isomerase n=1 Tax=Mycolicibacterium agri TaxID=36811 RepID=A0A2A7MPM9_MYCAG|nr:TIM barrel protein [Mycolicibacterium agri]PEG33453.1 hydroxypyruvate isomerase [Mycolicibacterium agri]GFG51593.1 hydroxypyruvate isomerase [Mycolicibacterium agri]